MDPHFAHTLTAVWQIVVVNVLLSGDNAVVIALACRNLSARYRKPALITGTAGAVVVRLAFCFVVASLLKIQGLKLIGGSLLGWIGVKLMVPEDEGGGEDVSGASGFWGALRTIIIADVVMSLDNVIAIVAAAKGKLPFIGFGLLLSIPIVIFGSQLVLKVLARVPLLVTAGAALLGWLGGEIMTSDPFLAAHHVVFGHWGARGVAAIGAALVVGIGSLLRRRAAAKPLEDLRMENPK